MMNKCLVTAALNAQAIATLGTVAALIFLPWTIMHIFIPVVNLIGDVFGR